MVIHIMFNDLPRNCNSYAQYINRIEEIIIKDLKKEYPDLSIDERNTVWDILLEIYAEKQDINIIFVHLMLYRIFNFINWKVSFLHQNQTERG